MPASLWQSSESHEDKDRALRAICTFCRSSRHRRRPATAVASASSCHSLLQERQTERCAWMSRTSSSSGVVAHQRGASRRADATDESHALLRYYPQFLELANDGRAAKVARVKGHHRQTSARAESPLYQGRRCPLDASSETAHGRAGLGRSRRRSHPPRLEEQGPLRRASQARQNTRTRPSLSCRSPPRRRLRHASRWHRLDDGEGSKYVFVLCMRLGDVGECDFDKGVADRGGLRVS